MNDKGHFLAFAIALAPATCVAWFSQARSAFLFGAVGALLGLSFAPYVMVEYNSIPSERDVIIETIGWDLPWTCGGALIGSAIGAIIVLRERSRYLQRWRNGIDMWD